MRPIKGQLPKAPPIRRTEPGFSVPMAPKPQQPRREQPRPSAPVASPSAPMDDPRVQRAAQAAKNQPRAAQPSAAAQRPSAAQQAQKSQPKPQPRAAAPQQPQPRAAAPQQQQPRAAAPQQPRRADDQPAPQQTPKSRSHLNLRTAQMQGDLGGNVQPLGALPAGATKKIFGQKPTKKVIARDPAPSRARYRMQRLWLTPMVRKLVHRGLPLIVVLGLGGYLAQDPELRNSLSVKLTQARENIQSRPEFRVELLKIKGADIALGEQVRKAAALSLPMTSFDLQLDGVRDRIEALDGVQSASLFLRSGGVLDVEVVPRLPVVLWRKDAQTLEMLDKDGTRAGTLSARVLRSDLPVIVGQGADKNIDQALEILRAAGPFADRIRGLTRIGERRWDLVLDRDQVIKLPVQNPVSAVRRVVALNDAQNLLSRDIVAVDLRNANRASLQLSPSAMQGMRQVETVSSEDNSDL